MNSARRRVACVRVHALAGSVAMALAAAVLALSGCGKQSAEVARLRDALDRLRSDLAEQQKEQRVASRHLQRRLARLEAELALLRHRPAPRATVDPAPGQEDPPEGRRSPEDPPSPSVSCPASLPAAARRLRRRMRLDKARKLLAGVRLRETRALTLSGAGSRTRRVWTGPCFRVTLEGGRVATVELHGVQPRRRRRRRRR